MQFSLVYRSVESVNMQVQRGGVGLLGTYCPEPRPQKGTRPGPSGKKTDNNFEHKNLLVSFNPGIQP